MLIKHLFGAFFTFCILSSSASTITIYISPVGNDLSDGYDISSPKRTIIAALEQIRKSIEKKDTNRLVLLPGEYFLQHPIVISPGYDPLIIEASIPGSVIIKGSKIVQGSWKKHKGEIMKLKLDFEISPYAQVYINGIQQRLSRYPNYDSAASHYNGFAPDAIDPKRVMKWKHPEGGIIHAMHRGEWGGFHYEIKQASKK